MNKSNLSIILPVYNEEKNISSLFNEIVSEVKSYIDDLEVIFVNDGSIDGSARIIENLASQYSFIRLIHNKSNQGYGAAIKKGIAAACNQWTLIMDTDGQLSIKELKNFWALESYYDFILGYRLKRIDNIYRKILGVLGTWLANLFLDMGVVIKDINCGFKLFKTEELQKLNLLASGNIIYFEILYKLSKYKLSFTQLAVTHYKRAAGKATGGKINTIIRILSEAYSVLKNTT
jgi:glycosyltransferase involved in cell wall biosynthesis